MPLGTVLILFGGLLSTMSALNATTFSSTRVAFAMGRDRNLPDVFARIHDRTRTPFLALLFSGSLILFVAVALPVEDVAAAADVMFLLLFLQVNVAVITIRKKYGSKLDYGYVTPFFPLIPILAIGAMLFLAVFMFDFSATAWMFVLIWIGSGLGVYHFYASRREREHKLTPIVWRRQRTIPAEQRFRILASISNPQATETVINVASRIARPEHGQLLLLHVATVPRQTPLRGYPRLLKRLEPVIENAEQCAESGQMDYETIVRVGHTPWKGIVDTVEEYQVKLVVMGRHGRSRHPENEIGQNVDQVVKQAPCDVLVVQQDAEIPARRILVPVTRPESVPLIVTIAQLLVDADAEDREIRVIHISGRESNTNSPERIRDQLEKLLQEENTSERPPDEAISPRGPVFFDAVESDDVTATIVERSQFVDLVLLGVSQQSWIHRKVFGEIGQQVTRLAKCPVALLNQESKTIPFEVQNFFQFFHELEDETADEDMSDS
jgi:nucleotide-binding universal stress UspA family protein